MSKPLAIVLSVLFFISINISAQHVQSFSNKPDKYLKEMGEFLQTGKNKKEGKKLINEFEELWESGAISEDQKRRIYSVSNALLKKRARSFPHFRDYLTVIIKYSQNNQSIDNYNNWEKGLLKLVKDKKMTIRKVARYLTTSAYLFSSNIVFKTATTTWQASNSNYRFIVEKTIRIEFAEIDLVCYAKRDSIKIFKTKGVFYPVEQIWKGSGGKVKWERAGYKDNEVHAQLSGYQIEMKKSSYKADSVSFVNTNYFDKPLMGTLEDAVRVVSSKENASYPRFESYNKRFEIKNIYENIDYSGGFSMHGAKFIGAGSETENAYFRIFRNDTLFLEAASKSFIFRKDRIVAPNTIITFRVDTDSIYHPGLLFKYFIDTREVSLVRDGQGMARSPYFNTYHDIDMDFELLRWKIDDPKIYMEMLKGSSINNARFESSSYYRQNRYDAIQGRDETSPLVAINKFSKKFKTDEFTVSQFTNYMRMDINQIRHVLLRLAFMGFISFNFETEEIKINERLFNYIKNRFGRKDYDVIIFNSQTQKKENASINLMNYNMKLFGVHEIFLSDSQNVVIYPRNEEVLLKRNRDFEFDGKVEAGLFTFYGNNFSFEYDNFKINLNDVDSLRLKVLSDQRDAYGHRYFVSVRSVVQDIKGDILIDNPMNKSGIKDYPQYPIFNSKKDSYVYYDKESILDGTYSKDKFYFQVYPYTIDSLDNFTKEGLAFKGYFNSGGIFPPFEETLTLQKDYSLGFIRSTPPGGMPMYGGKGTFNNDIKLSNKGLRGNGELHYVTSTTFSNDFIFYPDSMNTHAQSFVNNKQSSGVLFPDVMSDEVFVRWLPYQDKMLTHKKAIPISMFEDQAVLHGTLQLEPTGLTGWGQMDFEGAELASDLMRYQDDTFDADTAAFRLKDLDMSDFTFKTNNVNAHIDFIERKGIFKSNGAASFVEFPQNQYICFMDQFDWFMDKEEIEMSASKKVHIDKPEDQLSPSDMEDIQLSGSQFISVHPNQDSLEFIAPSAKYSLRKKLITAKDVQHIDIADSRLYLSEKGEVIIEKKAKMRTIKNATIKANKTTRYHTIYNVTANIYGKKDYSATGDYEYVDEVGTKQKIHFNVIAVDTTTQTYASGRITEPMKFTLSPSYLYQGFVRMNASQEYLTFTGSAKLKHECNMLKEQWFNFFSEINPKEIYIPIGTQPVSINNDPLSASIMLAKDSAHIYTTFLTKRKNFNDIPILPVEGFLYYSNAEKKYKISNREKLIEFNMPGNYLHIHKELCNAYGEGMINLGVNLGRIEIVTTGNINHNMTTDQVDLDLIMALDFFFANKCIELMAQSINTDATLAAVDMTRRTFAKGLAELVGKEEADKHISELNLYGTFRRTPKNLVHTMFITDLKMEWDPEISSYNSVGMIGIGSIMKDQVNKFVKGHIQITKKRSGDLFTIYLELDSRNWFFFSYARNIMQGLSSNEEFNTIIKELKPDKRKLDQNREKGLPLYTFFLAPVSRKKKFLLQFEEEKDTPDIGE